MRNLEQTEIDDISAGSIVGVIALGTAGFWAGGVVGFLVGGWTAVPGAIIGSMVGAYLGLDDPQERIIYVHQGATTGNS